MSETYLSISQVNNYIKNIFEAEVMLQNICVFGEVSSYKISNGISYFNLQYENGLLPCVLFGANRFDVPNVGDMVLVVGSVSYYAKGGKLSFNATHIAPYGKGLLYEKFLKLKEELESRGYFNLDHKKPLPERVNRIGVVTSATGAVIQDIIDVTHRRNKGVDIVLYPVKVQGIGAEVEIAKGINFFSEYPNVDVVIVARGGGSLEDLQPFNTELVAEATYNCLKPIVSAVGHETDTTIIDFVSDLRAPTPSAAAELVVNKISDDLKLISNCVSKIENYVSGFIYEYFSTTNNCVNSVDLIIRNKILSNSSKLNLSVSKVDSIIKANMVNMEHKYEILSNKLISLNPIVPLQKGYVKVENNNNVVKSSKDILKNQTYNLFFADGKAIVKGE